MLILTPHFHPENFKCNDMAFELQRRGHKVTVLTPIPDYPKGKFFDGYGVFKKRKEMINGVNVYRSLIIPRGSGSRIRLALNYLSYTFCATFFALWFAFTKKYDAIIVHETSPVLVGIPAVLVKKIQKIPLYFWVLDLWPESLSAAGGIKNQSVLSIFEKITKWIYSNCDHILIGSKGYEESIRRKCPDVKSITYFPNWVEESLVSETKSDVPNLPDGFNVMIAGNMGDAQALPFVMDAALKLNDKPINFIFIGDGRKQPYVLDFVKTHSLESKIHCPGRFPLEKMPALFEQADVLLFSLKDVPIFAITVPSRLQAYMAAGKPVVAMINGEARDLIREADCGWSVPAEDSEALAALLAELSVTDPSILQAKGENGKRFSREHFDFKKCMDNLEKIVTKGL